MGFLGAFFGFGQDSSNGHQKHGKRGRGKIVQRPGLSQPTLAPKAWKASGLRISSGCIQPGRPGLAQPSMMPVKLSNQNDPNTPTVDLSTQVTGQNDVGSTQYGYNIASGSGNGSSGLQGWLAGHKQGKKHGHRHGPHHPN